MDIIKGRTDVCITKPKKHHIYLNKENKQSRWKWNYLESIYCVPKL